MRVPDRSPHRRGRWLVPAVLALGCWLTQPAVAQVVLRGTVFGIGGGVSADREYRLVATLGQPFVGGASNASTGLSSGFWQAAAVIVRVDVEADRLEQAVPRHYHLRQNYPNPFNPETTIPYDVQAPARVVLQVFNLLGQEVATLVDAQHAPGRYEAHFEASGLPSGTYFYRVEMGDFRDVKMMTLVK